MILTVGQAVKVAKPFDYGGFHFPVGAVGVVSTVSAAPKFMFVIGSNGIAIYVTLSTLAQQSAGWIVPA